ncbi:hypothetical protein ACQ4M3_09330 [Leptolyngbya sp. AN03gr2]|uniref:hypothetical protein n=1 Tax=Leptolyngbya sp. AN03gr2 TaxID=3423364 RepID=UPI003D323636
MQPEKNKKSQTLEIPVGIQKSDELKLNRALEKSEAANLYPGLDRLSSEKDDVKTEIQQSRGRTITTKTKKNGEMEAWVSVND